MKKLVIAMLVGLVFPFCVNAQLSRPMSKYHEKNGVTVTQLDKSLYGLYQKNNLPSEAAEMLQKLDEVNILNVNLELCEPDLGNKIITQFKGLLDNPDKYKLIKSHNGEFGKQLIYSRSKNGKVSDLVVWDQSPEQLDLVELRGDIQLDKIAMLSRVLNLKGLNSLAALSSNPNTYQSYKQAYNFGNDMGDMFQGIQEAMNQIQSQFFGNNQRDSLRPSRNSISPFEGMFESLFGKAGQDLSEEEFLNAFKNGMGNVQNVRKFVQSFSDADNTTSNSVEITEENGKTKIKINSKNSDMTYIIDGVETPKNNIQMPENILTVNIIPSKEDIKKSYLFITSGNKLGEFISYKNGVLTFKYNNQEYKYNPDKLQKPVLVIDGRLSSTFSTDPSEILQIRPLSQIEKEVGYYPNAEVIINTKMTRLMY